MNESAPPASRRPGEQRSAIPGLCLLCANLLLGALVLGSFVRPAAFGLAPHQPTIATLTPTTSVPFDISALPTAAATTTITSTTATQPKPTATPRASHATPAPSIPTPTPTPNVPTPTALPVSPTPRPTVLPGA